MRFFTLLALFWIIPAPAGAQDAETAADGDGASAAAVEEANQVFFAGIDMMRAGDCEGAVARFQLALSRNPELIQARLYEAECYLQLDLRDECVRSVTAYLEDAFEGAETTRAQELYGECGGDPEAMPVPDDARVGGGGASGAATTLTAAGDSSVSAAGAARAVPSIPDPVATWSVAAVELGAVVEHIDNSAGLTVLGPLAGVRLLPARYLELGLRGRVGFGPYGAGGGSVTVPEVGVSAAASIPVGRTRLVIGAAVPLVFSGYGGRTYVDPGVLAEVGLRVAVRDTRLVVGGLLEGGYLVRPVVGASLRVGIQLGEVGRR